MEHIEDIIATRTFTGPNETQVIVVVGKPIAFPDSTDYYTPYQIIGAGKRRIRRVGGVDSLQSLQLAMKMIGHDLFAINKSLDYKLKWDGDEQGSLGFPLPKS